MQLLAIKLWQNSKLPSVSSDPQWLTCELLACPNFEIKCVSLRFLVLCDHLGSDGRSSEEAAIAELQ